MTKDVTMDTGYYLTIDTQCRVLSCLGLYNMSIILCLIYHGWTHGEERTNVWTSDMDTWALTDAWSTAFDVHLASANVCCLSCSVMKIQTVYILIDA